MSEQVIVVGAGNWGKNLVRNYFELGALAGVAEASEELRRQLMAEYPSVPLYADYKEALEASAAKAFVIATPAHTHYQIAIDAMEANKDVFVEKPITLSSDEAGLLIRKANLKNVILMVGHLLLYQPAIKFMKNAIDEGLIGDLKSLHQERMKLGRVRSVENVLWSFGVHDLAVFLYLTGSEPTRIQLAGDRFVQPSVEDDVYFHADFPNHVSAHLHVSWLWPEQRRNLTVIGTKGMLVYDEQQQTVTMHYKTVDPGTLQHRDDGTEIVFRGEANPLRLECEHFLECIAERRQPISDGRNGLEVVKILENAELLLKGAVS